MATTSLVGTLNGIVAYTDETSESFHTHIETDPTKEQYWNIANSIQTLASDADRAHQIRNILNSVPSVLLSTWTPADPSSKTVKDVILNLSLTVTDDQGNTKPFSTSYQFEQLTVHLGTDQSIDNDHIDKLMHLFGTLTNSDPTVKLGRRINLIDNSETGTVKRIVLYKTNTAAGYNEPTIWKNIYLNGNSYDFDPIAAVTIHATSSTTTYKSVTATNGYKYSITNGKLKTYDTTAGSEFQVYNNTSEDITVTIERDSDITDTRTLTPGSSAAFSYTPTFYIGVLNSFTSNPTLAESGVNTQISVLGVGSADLSMTKPSSYSFSLTNVAYA